MLFHFRQHFWEMTLYGGDVYIEVGMSVSQNRNVFFTKKLDFFFF